MSGMFEHLTIVEFSSVLAGPLTATFFAELGAKVYKVENALSQGDATRKWKLPQEDPRSPISAYYASANYNKEVIMANLKDKDDYQNIINLVTKADIVISNFKAGSAEKLKLDYNALKHYNPSLIYAALTGYGDNDPRPAYDLVLQAETGFMSMNGHPDKSPAKIPVAIIDILAAHHLKEAILCALIRRSQTGKGDYVHVSLYEAAIASLVNQATNYLMTGVTPQRMGSLHPNIAPYGEVLLSADKAYILLAIGTDAQFARLAEFIELDISDFHSNVLRLKHRDILFEHLSEAFAKHHADFWLDKLRSLNIPHSKIYTIKEALDNPMAQSKLISDDIEGQTTIRPKTAYI